MTSDGRYDPGVLDTMACDIGARPAGAPHFDDVAAAVRAVRREGSALIVDYDPAAAGTLAAIVDAERRCCGGIGWHLQRPVAGDTGAASRLRIEATPAQLDAIELLFAPSGDTAHAR